MKTAFLSKALLFVVLFAAINAFSWPVYDPFNYPIGQTIWSQFDTNTGDQWYEIDSGANGNNAIDVANVSVTYPGLPASAGYSMILSNVNGAQGPRMFITSNSVNWPGNAGGQFCQQYTCDDFDGH